jgi:hypothetical protein
MTVCITCGKPLNIPDYLARACRYQCQSCFWRGCLRDRKSNTLPEYQQCRKCGQIKTAAKHFTFEEKTGRYRSLCHACNAKQARRAAEARKHEEVKR